MDDIYKYYKKNSIWEDKGILLGLIYYITKNYERLINKELIMNDINIIKLLKKFFPDQNLSNKIGENKNIFVINIKSYCDNGDLCINNLQNFPKHLEFGKIYILPWLNYENPIVLIDNQKKKYKYDNIYINNKIKILKQKSKIAYNFTYPLDIIDYDYYMNNRKLEKRILKIYIKKMSAKKDYIYLRNYINKKLLPVKYKNDEINKYQTYTLDNNTGNYIMSQFNKNNNINDINIAKNLVSQKNLNNNINKIPITCDYTRVYKDIGDIITKLNTIG
jgi:hypothetical protein